LNAAAPKELGGLGLNLAEIVQQQRRLAYHAGPTALGVHMHFYWTGLAADIWRDTRLGLIHPANTALAHEFLGKTALGINPDEQPRWG